MQAPKYNLSVKTKKARACELPVKEKSKSNIPNITINLI